MVEAAGMVTWLELRTQRPDLAEAGRDLLYQFGVGLAFLGTVRADGGPRLHPICPLLGDDGLHAFLIPSPKARDLVRDARYALHSFPPQDNEDAVYLTGRAELVDDPDLFARLAEQFAAERSQFGVRPEAVAGQQLVRFDVESCLITRTTGHGDPEPQHTVWRSAG
jgi:hypothetical protein